MEPIVQKELNKQIQEELYSAYLYLSMSAYLASEGLSGAANWMRLQYEEEMLHAMKFFDFVLARGGEVELLEIAQPPKTFGSLEDCFVGALEHEKHITGRINGLYELSMKEKDYAVQSFLKWFVDEQVEEEGNVNEALDKLKHIGPDSKEGLLLIDNWLKERVAAPANSETATG